MLQIGKRHQRIIIALAIMFLLGRIMGLHAHGHIDLKHDHNTPLEFTQTHNHTLEHAHFVSHISDTHDHLDNNHDDHAGKIFEIENTAIVKKQFNNLDLTLVLLFIAVLIAWFRPRRIKSTRTCRTFSIPFPKKQYLKHQPLRAPPLLV